MRRYEELDALAKALEAAGVSFAFVHEAALASWGMDANLFMLGIDVLLDKRGFSALEEPIPEELGTFTLVKDVAPPVRLWSTSSLGLMPYFETVESPVNGCRVLAPEQVLAKLPYSPDLPLIREGRALLAATLLRRELTERQLEAFIQSVSIL